jgi:hypothetical protein
MGIDFFKNNSSIDIDRAKKVLVIDHMELIASDNQTVFNTSILQNGTKISLKTQAEEDLIAGYRDLVIQKKNSATTTIKAGDVTRLIDLMTSLKFFESNSTPGNGLNASNSYSRYVQFLKGAYSGLELPVDSSGDKAFDYMLVYLSDNSISVLRNLYANLSSLIKSVDSEGVKNLEFTVPEIEVSYSYNDSLINTISENQFVVKNIIYPSVNLRIDLVDLQSELNKLTTDITKSLSGNGVDNSVNYTYDNTSSNLVDKLNIWKDSEGTFNEFIKILNDYLAGERVSAITHDNIKYFQISVTMKNALSLMDVGVDTLLLIDPISFSIENDLVSSNTPTFVIRVGQISSEDALLKQYKVTMES